MAFPTTPILDNFNRANESPLGGGWSANPIYGGVGMFRIVSNQAQNISGASGHGYWATSFGADQEVYATIADWAGFNGFYLLARGTDFNNDFNQDYYLLTVSKTGNSFELTRVINDSGTVIGSTTQVISSGDSIGLVCAGSSIQGWYKSSGGNWTKLLDVTDSGIANGGNIGMIVDCSTPSQAIIDDFGGGNYVATVEMRRGGGLFAF